MPGQISIVRSSQQNKENIIMSENEWFYGVIERLHLKINTVTMQYFTYNWHNTLQYTFPI
jgi:hypothetical protein